MSESKSNNVKKRNWAFVLYPESAPKDWREQLQQTGLQCAISPLHDKDVNPDGEKKKAHYHIILVYSGPTSFNVVKKLTESLNQPIPQPLEQIRGYYRYLTHKDNPEKYQYPENEITTINGFNINDFVDLTKSEVLTVKKNLLDIIEELDFYEYSDFVDYVKKNGNNDELDIATGNTLFFNSYIKSKKYKAEKGTPNFYILLVNKETGEIVEERFATEEDKVKIREQKLKKELEERRKKQNEKE